jgi:hypothetical protein
MPHPVGFDRLAICPGSGTLAKSPDLEYRRGERRQASSQGYMSEEGEVAMRWPRRPRVMGVLLIALALIIYVVVMWGGIPLLWPYRDHPLVRVLLAFLTGGHLEELL